ncbi:TPA: hypothetical protein PPN70_003783 [Serratia rubidaea]|uniref:hypothetical protein n=1 Tax=Serratia rubidaea TaxID=61652 RepID=UPI0023B086C3|nr:hypothetical protein [Serratia rubidaea]MDK1705211.1 hypothetical protein [Serratia rubidaea]HDJ1441337.1 hypothetical protein [Serratia rubidaea]HDJ1450528.1 hypothetical protein [Serratia rubidaea]HDJ1463869.1 hypothetical protein [Serratia rubidaea]HDJ2774021.1 hypothetical protein [Serratia rubidaea]
MRKYVLLTCALLLPFSSLAMSSASSLQKNKDAAAAYCDAQFTVVKNAWSESNDDENIARSIVQLEDKGYQLADFGIDKEEYARDLKTAIAGVRDNKAAYHNQQEEFNRSLVAQVEACKVQAEHRLNAK